MGRNAWFAVDTCSASVLVLWQSRVRCLGVDRGVPKLDSSGDTWRNTWLDCGYMFCFSAPGFWTIFPAFPVDSDSDPEVFLSVLTSNGVACSVDATGHGPCIRSPHLNLSLCEPQVDDSWHDEG